MTGPLQRARESLRDPFPEQTVEWGRCRTRPGRNERSLPAVSTVSRSDTGAAVGVAASRHLRCPERIASWESSPGFGGARHNREPFVVTLLTALGCGIMAGALFAFSAFVMAALGRLEPANGLAAMQSINVLAVTPAFMTAFFGTAIACLGLIVWPPSARASGRWPCSLSAAASTSSARLA